jgi:O-antigen/teichoic acid export membrane protein
MGVANSIRQLAGETLIYGISGTLSRFIGIFLLPMYTRVFSPADYGVVGVMTSLLALCGVLIVLGLDNASARWFYDTGDTLQRKRIMSSWFWCQMTVGMLAALLLLLLAPQIAALLLGTRDLAHLVRIAALTVPLGSFVRVLGNWLRYQRRAAMVTTYYTSTSLGLLGIIALFVLTWPGGLLGLYWAHLVAGLLTAAASVMIIRTWIAPRFVSWPVLKSMLAFGLPLAPASVASWMTALSDRLILSLFRDSSEVGVYTVAASLASVVALVTQAFQWAWGPFAFSLLRDRESAQVYSKALSLYALLGAFLCTAASLFSPWLLRVFATAPYYGAASNIPWLAFSHLAVGATTIAALGSQVVKKSGSIAMSAFVGAGINTLLNFLLIPAIGRDGAAIATFVAYTSATAYMFVASQKHYPLPYHFKDVILCAGFGWLLIGIDRLLVPGWSALAVTLRVALCLSYVPLAFGLGIVRPAHVRQALAHVGRHLRGAAA